MNKDVQLPLLFLGEYVDYKKFLHQTGFIREEVKFISTPDDIKGHKDTVIFMTGWPKPHTRRHYQAIADYADHHNIRKVRL